jgi:hypothetical protein
MDQNLMWPSFDNAVEWSSILFPVEIDAQATATVVGFEAGETAHPFAPCPRE